MIDATDSQRLGTGSRHVADALARQQQRLDGIVPRLSEARPEDIHDGRVAARRLRSLLKTYQPMLEPRRARLYRLDLRSFARALGAVREADVLAELVVGLATTDASVSPTARTRVVRLAEREREAARAALAERVAGAQWRALSRALLRHGADQRLLTEKDAGLEQVLDRVDRPFRKAMRLLEKKPSDADALHQLRLAFKHCRYALESVADVAPTEASRLLRSLRRVQDSIGSHRDVVLARQWVEHNRMQLGARLAGRLDQLLAGRDADLLVESVKRSRKVRSAHQRWWSACRRATRAASPARA
jgi:CHAD domain-containing protein